MSATRNFIGGTTSEPALRLAVGIPDYREAALANPALSEELWFSQYRERPKPSVKDAKTLVTRYLSSAQVDHLIKTEARPAVLGAAFKITEPTLTQLHDLLGSKALTAKFANDLTQSYADLIDVAWLREAAKVGGSARIEYWLRAPQETEDAEIIEALTDYNSWGAEWDTKRWHWLLTSRPSVLPGAVASNSPKVRTAAAGNRFLTDPTMQRQLADITDAPDAESVLAAWCDARAFTWVALVCNPACDLEVVEQMGPYLKKLTDFEHRYRADNRLAKQPWAVTTPFEEVEDHNVLAWLLRRTLPGMSKDAGRPWDLAALAANPHLSEGEAREIISSLQHAVVTLTYPGVLEALTGLANRFPTVAAEYDMAPAQMQVLVREFGEARVNQAAQDREDKLGHCAETVDEDRVETAAKTTVSNVRHSWLWDAAVVYLDREIGDEPAAWAVAFRLLDQNDFVGTVADLALIANATA